MFAEREQCGSKALIFDHSVMNSMAQKTSHFLDTDMRLQMPENPIGRRCYIWHGSFPFSKTPKSNSFIHSAHMNQLQ